MRATAAHEREEEYLFEFSEVFRQGRYLPYRCEVLQCSFCPELSSGRCPCLTRHHRILPVRSLLSRSLPGPIGPASDTAEIATTGGTWFPGAP